MTYYVVYIFQMANLTGNVGLVSSGVQYAVFIIGTAATFFFIDRTGRRPLLVSYDISIPIFHYLDFPDLRRSCHGNLHVRRWRRAGNIRYISPERT